MSILSGHEIHAPLDLTPGKATSVITVAFFRIQLQLKSQVAPTYLELCIIFFFAFELDTWLGGPQKLSEGLR
jgi:hypothetical protein